MIVFSLPPRLPAAALGLPAPLCEAVPGTSPGPGRASGPSAWEGGGRRDGRTDGRGLRGNPLHRHPWKLCPGTQFFHCPPVSTPPFGKPRGGRGRRAGPLPPGALPRRPPASCRRNARRYAPVSRSGSPSLLEQSSAYITRWQRSTFPAVS